MTTALALAALIAGLTGSAHCAGMCGPIVSVFENSSGAQSLDWQRRLAYHVGRLFTYLTIGAIAGLAGFATLHVGPAEQTGMVLRLVAALALLLLGLRMLRVYGSNALDAVGRRMWRWLSPLARYVLPMHSRRRALGAGLLWGAIPCGLLYGVAALAIGTGSLWQGALIMGLFWLGTLPALVTLGRFTQQSLKLRTRTIAGGLSVGVAVIAIATAVMPHGHGDHDIHSKDGATEQTMHADHSQHMGDENLESAPQGNH
ncbi:MAG: sulfite exporter TauE/SafE family protein [Pseudomonadota bacterium]